jgi:hypothetical protein
MWQSYNKIYSSLNILEPYGPVQACNGNASPLPYTIKFLQNLCRCTFFIVLHIASLSAWEHMN